jgi:7-cyano-7-deazaguanine synthase
MRKVVVLFSGGVESTSLLVHYLRRGFLLYPVYVRAGLPWEEVERRYALRIWLYLKRRYGRILPLRTVLMGDSGKRFRGTPLTDRQMEIPLRNMVLMVKTALLAYRRKADLIGIGSLGVYPFPDNNRDYLDRLQELISAGLGRELRIDTPFMGKEKWQIVRDFGDSVPYHLTFSCADPVGNMHCGVCAKCRERKEGFTKAGFKDPTPYWTS